MLLIMCIVPRGHWFRTPGTIHMTKRGTIHMTHKIYLNKDDVPKLYVIKPTKDFKSIKEALKFMFRPYLGF